RRRGGARRRDGRAPRGELRTERALELADVLGEIGFDGARGERLAHGRERRHVAAPLVEGATEQRPEDFRVAAERDGAAQGADGFARAVVVHERFAEAMEDVGCRDAVLRVLDAEAEDLLALHDVAEAHASRAEKTE